MEGRDKNWQGRKRRRGKKEGKYRKGKRDEK